MGGDGELGASDELIGECTGACASSSISCKIELRFGEPAGNELWDVAEFKCNRAVPHFQLEVCLLIENSATGGFPNIDDDPCNHEGARQGQVFNNASTYQAYVITSCATGEHYRGWVWGYGYGGDFVLKSHGRESPTLTCTGQGSADAFTEIFEYITS
ncbi:MAG: hypothetical protein WBQ21_07430 [Solirubrobacteraceae bacterium]